MHSNNITLKIQVNPLLEIELFTFIKFIGTTQVNSTKFK